MAQFGSSSAALANERDDSSWLNAQSKRIPWSKYACASLEDVVMVRWKLPRPSNNCALSAHCPTVAGTFCIWAAVGKIVEHIAASALPQNNMAGFIRNSPNGGPIRPREQANRG